MGNNKGHNIVSSCLHLSLQGCVPKQMSMIMIGLGILGSQHYSTSSQRHLNKGGLVISWQKQQYQARQQQLLEVWHYIGVGEFLSWKHWKVMNEWITEVLQRKSGGDIKRTLDRQSGLPFDEISMLTTDLLTVTLQVTSFVKMGNRKTDSMVPFGGKGNWRKLKISFFDVYRKRVVMEWNFGSIRKMST